MGSAGRVGESQADAANGLGVVQDKDGGEVMESKIDREMRAAADEIYAQILRGEPVSKEDRRFLDSFMAAHSDKYAGNAGKRKKERSGK